MPKYSVISKLLYKAVPLEYITKTKSFFLKGVTPIKIWEDGKVTDRIEGYTYDVVDSVNFDPYKIKVPGQLHPLLSEEKIQEAQAEGERILVSFADATVTLYLNQNKELATDSYKAADIELLESEA